jgi:DNA gyrase subunit A
VISSAGMVLRLRVKSINPTGRATRGVRIMDVHEGDSVAALARVMTDDLPQNDAENSPPKIESEA